MQVHTFLADSTADAVAQIREKLGPDAVVLNVRRVAGEGFSRLWNKPRIEVMAHLPERAAAEIPDQAIALLRQEICEIKQKFVPTNIAEKSPVSSLSEIISESTIRSPRTASSTWRVSSFLEESGLLPIYAQRIVDELESHYGEAPPDSLAKEIDLARGALHNHWQSGKTRPKRDVRAHVFIGAPGVGKTTCLCKWLTQTVLLQSNTAEVWRLDGHLANTAESLSIYGEILGVPVARSQEADWTTSGASTLFIDLPGVNLADTAAVDQLARRLTELPNPEVHLVLNAAYDLRLLLAQVRAFSSLPISDLMFTHLDEEPRWGKLWNFVLGTNYTIRFLSAGQNIPGEFHAATSERILARQFERNR